MVGSLINKIKIFYKVLDEKYTNIAEIDFKALSKVKVAEMWACTKKRKLKISIENTLE